MRYHKVQTILSIPRIDRYFVATGSKTNAVRLYKANLKIAQAFHPILGILEVILRNRINDILAVFFGDMDWLISQKRGFMSDPSLTYFDKRTNQRKTNDFLKKSVLKSENRLRRFGTVITSGKIIADQTLGFWTELFETLHYRLLQGRPIQIFTHLPPSIGRREVRDRLNDIRQFRNRINHNEPICFNGNNIDFTYAESIYRSVHEILSWIDPDINAFTSDLDKVLREIAFAKRI
ncbi:Abi family protein [Pedobacter hartonius]|uniref:Abi-like protein n=1 Tax=Pedobacter hartonius TaxID=425514 RepID=A0A1H3ZKH3_9SPHI|nr:Abi family protein [Pedobacter hartonius]SEA23764.1 Abi-like protein [Pedobacter hartonius]